MKSSIRNVFVGVIALVAVLTVASLFWFSTRPASRPSPTVREEAPPPSPPGKTGSKPTPPSPGQAESEAPRVEAPEAVPPPPAPARAEISPAAVKLVDEILRELDWGNIAFNAPATMRYAQPRPVELLLSPALSVTDLQEKLHQKVGAQSAHIQVSNIMEAQLTGTGFTIEAQRPALQAVTSQQITRWVWRVTPTELGRRTLHLTLSAHLDVAGRDAPLVVQTFHRAIQVDITIRQRISAFIQNNWQWLWAAVLVPVAGYLWKIGKGRRVKPKEKRKKHVS